MKTVTFEGQQYEVPGDGFCPDCEQDASIDSVLKEARKETAPYEVGGTCDQGRIIHIEPSGLRVLVGLDNRVVFGIEITDYKPPVKVKAWHCAGYISNNPVTVDAWNKDGTAVAGYWTPEAK
jgi:hypothetical protein